MIKIGDFAKICNVSTQTLRYYDAEGILKADVVDSSSGYRFYSIDAVEKYKQIVFYKNLGFSLDEIKKIQLATKEELQIVLQKKREELFHSIKKFETQIKIIDELCDSRSQRPALAEILLLPFENDPDVVGKWKLCGKLVDETDWTCLCEISEDIIDKEIIFMPGGGFAWKYFWTKGILYRLSPKYKFAIPNLYKTFEQDGVDFMIVQFMSDDCIDNGDDTMMLLYRQVDNNEYTEYTIRSNVDKTDLPFVDDDAIHGVWNVIDFVPTIADFDIRNKYIEDEDLYVKNIHFLRRGICTRTVRAGTGNINEVMLRYTKGFVINDKEMTAEEYQIKVIDGKEILFVQHKSGDYFYGGKIPHWYVFERKV